MARPPASPPSPWLYAVPLLVLALGLGAAGWAWFEANFALRPQQDDTGFSAAARQNPWLAAERYLARLGLAVTSVRGRTLLRDLPPTGDTLLIRGLGPLNDERQRLLYNWIEAGGHLLVEAMDITAADAAPRPSDFLGWLGIRLRDDGTGPGEPDGPALPPCTAALDGADCELDAADAFDPRYYLEEQSGAPLTVLTQAGRRRMLRRDLGAGRLTVLADSAFMTNGRIGEPPHALLLARLLADATSGARADTRVWIITDGVVPDLATLLWRAAPQAIGAAALLVALLVWRAGARLGPLIALPAPGRRDLLAHLAAAGALLWRHGRGLAHLAPAQRRVEGAWLRRHPLLRGLAPPERARWLGARLGLDPAAVSAALYRHGGAADPLADARTLQRLWVGLHAGPGARPAPPGAG